MKEIQIFFFPSSLVTDYPMAIRSMPGSDLHIFGSLSRIKVMALVSMAVYELP